MIIYLNTMRVKDQNKRDALFRATIKVVNEIGFASSSVSKIAKQAGVSPATLYTYFDNKDDLITSTYIEIKRKLGRAAAGGIEGSIPVRDCFKQMWINLFEFASRHTDYLQFSEQFANSPYAEQVDQARIDKMLEPLGSLIRKGIEMKIIKDVNPDVIGAFIFYPVIILSNPRLCRNFNITDEQVNSSFQLAWDAIRR